METANQIANVLLPFCHKIAEGLSKRKPLGYLHNAVVFIFHLCLQAHNIASLQNPLIHSSDTSHWCNCLVQIWQRCQPQKSHVCLQRHLTTAFDCSVIPIRNGWNDSCKLCGFLCNPLVDLPASCSQSKGIVRAWWTTQAVFMTSASEVQSDRNRPYMSLQRFL